MKLFSVKNIPFFAYVFMIIYTPALSTFFLFEKYYMVALLSVVALAVSLAIRRSITLSLFKNRYMVILMATVFLSSVYVFLIMLAKQEPISSFADTRIIQNNIINFMAIHAIVVVSWFKAHGFFKCDIIRMLIVLGGIQGVICVLSFFITPLKEFSVYLYQVGSGFAEQSYNSWIIDYRIFGISNDFTFGTPIYHAIIAIMGTYCVLLKQIPNKYSLMIALTMIAAIVNSKTALVLLIVFLPVLVIRQIYISRASTRIFKNITLMAILIVPITLLISVYSPNTMELLSKPLNDATEVLNDNADDQNSFSNLQRHLFLPDNFVGIVFGEGHRVYGSSGYGANSDVGYVNDIYLGGVVFMGGLYMAVLNFIVKNTKDKYVAQTLVFLLFVSNIKGEVFHSSTVMFLAIVIAFENKYLPSKALNSGRMR